MLESEVNVEIELLIVMFVLDTYFFVVFMVELVSLAGLAGLSGLAGDR